MSLREQCVEMLEAAINAGEGSDPNTKEYNARRFVEKNNPVDVAQMLRLMREAMQTIEFYSKGGNFQTDIWKHEELGFFTGKRAKEFVQKWNGVSK